MAIAKCECGFRRKLSDENIGKKGKCPKCHKMIIVAAEKEVETPHPKKTFEPEPVVNTALKSDKVEWRFSVNKKRFGLVSEDRIIELIKRNKITKHSSVWNQSMDEWINVMESPFANLIRDSEIPHSINGEQVSNTIVWLLAFAIIIGHFSEGFISGLTGIDKDYLFFITIGLNIWLCVLDEKKILEAGYDASDLGSVWIVPVYLFKRAKKLNHNYSYFIVWCVIFGLYLFQ